MELRLPRREGMGPLRVLLPRDSDREKGGGNEERVDLFSVNIFEESLDPCDICLLRDNGIGDGRIVWIVFETHRLAI